MPHNQFGAIEGFLAQISGRWWLAGQRELGALSANLVLDEDGSASLVSDTPAPLVWLGQSAGFKKDWHYVDAIHGECGILGRPVDQTAAELGLTPYTEEK